MIENPVHRLKQSALPKVANIGLKEWKVDLFYSTGQLVGEVG